jgi:hypothetical protein
MKRSNGILEIVEGIAKDVPTDRHAAGPCRRTRCKMDERTCATTTTTTTTAAVARAKNVQRMKKTNCRSEKKWRGNLNFEIP